MPPHAVWLALCRYVDAAKLLELERQNFPRSRAALSLLAYCYYYMQDFRSAADVSGVRLGTVRCMAPTSVERLGGDDPRAAHTCNRADV